MSETPDRELPPTLAETVQARLGVELDAEMLAAAFDATIPAEGGVAPHGTTRKVPRPDGQPSELGRYPVTGLLGRGGMGEVLEVRDRDLGRLLAAKVMHGRISGDRVARFVREARICGQLEHPNIVPVHELSLAADGRVYFTMKRVEGETLDELVVRMCSGDVGASARGLPTRVELLQTFLKLCDAIAYAHSRRVIHRDLKPANVMVGRFGEVVVMDWGLAKRLDEPEPDPARAPGTRVHLRPEGSQLDAALGQGQPSETLEGTIVGTPAYMPPEQAEGRQRDVDERADVYALGAILYELLTLEVPFEAPSAMQVIEQVVLGRLRPPSERAPQLAIPYELDAIVMRAMATGRERRYQTVGELRADVQRYLAGRPLGAVQYSPGQLLLKWAARNKALVGAAAAVLLIGLTIGVVAFVQVARAYRAEQAAAGEAKASAQKANDAMEAESRERRAATEALRVARVRLSEALVHKAIGALAEQRTLDAALLVAEAGRVSDTTLAQAARFLLPPPLLLPVAVAEVESRERAILALAVSPDGSRIATGGHDNAIVLTRTDGTPLGQLPHPLSTHVEALAYSVDGLLAVSGWDGVVRLWPPGESETPRTIDTDQGQIKSVAFSPDGRLLATGGQHNTVCVWDVATGARAAAFELPSNQGGSQKGLHVHAVAFSADGARVAASGMVREIGVFTLASGARARLAAHTHTVNGLAFAPDGTLLSASTDRTLRLWEPQPDGSYRMDADATLTHRTGVTGVSIAPGGQFALTTSLDGSARWYSLLDRRCVQTLTCGSPVHAGHCTDRLAATGDASGRVVVWRIRQGKPRRYRLPHPAGAIVAFAMSRDGRRAATVGYFGDVQQLDVRTGRVTQVLGVTMRGRGSSHFALAYLPDGRLAYGAPDGTLALLDPRPDADPRVRQLAKLEAGVVEVQVSRDGRWLAASPRGKPIRVYDLTRGRFSESLPPTPATRGMLFGRRGVFVTGTVGGVDVYQTDGPEGWRRTMEIRVRGDKPQALALTRDDETLAIANGRKPIRLHSLRTGALVRELVGHGDYVRSLAFSPDDRMLVSGSTGRDAIARVWDVASGRTLQTFDEHSWGLTGLGFSPDGTHLVTAGSNDQAVFVRGVDAPASVDAAMRHAGLRVAPGRTDLLPLSPADFRALGAVGLPPGPWPEEFDDDVRRGQMHLGEAQPLIASRVFERALRLRRDWVGYYLLGVSLIRIPGATRAQLARAVIALRQAQALAPPNRRALVARELATAEQRLRR